MPRDISLSERLFRMNDIFNNRFGAESAVSTRELTKLLSIGRSQLFKDFERLKDLGAPLIWDAGLKGYRYTEPFHIAGPTPLTTEELANLRIGVEMLSRIEHLEGFKQLPDVFKKLRKSIRRWSLDEAPHKAIYFDPLPRYEAGRHLPFMLQAIEYCRQITFEYQAFHATQPKKVVFDPYFLRHYDRRWYVGGFSHDPSEGFVRTFPLERIVGTPAHTGSFFPSRPGYDSEHYWKYIYGITIPPNGKVEDVDLQFTAIQGRYFQSTPFFEPFQVLDETTEHLVIRLRLIPNFDLVRKLGSLGASVKVLHPDSLVEEIKHFHQRALAVYS